MAAGLGGGSSDAAAALRLANMAGNSIGPNRLAELAAELGSDVPFFVYGGAAICRGRGERVERLPAMPTLHFVVVKPPVGLSTATFTESHDPAQQIGIELGTLQLSDFDERPWPTLGRFASLDAQRLAVGRRIAHALG